MLVLRKGGESPVSRHGQGRGQCVSSDSALAPAVEECRITLGFRRDADGVDRRYRWNQGPHNLKYPSQGQESEFLVSLNGKHEGSMARAVRLQVSNDS